MPTQIIIGRSDQSDVMVEDSTVSRQHLELTIDGQTIMARDMGSSNGSYIVLTGGVHPLGTAQVTEASEIKMGEFICTVAEVLDAYGRDRIEREGAKQSQNPARKKGPISMYIRSGDGSYRKG